jgi:hypothetical protein
MSDNGVNAALHALGVDTRGEDNICRLSPLMVDQIGCMRSARLRPSNWGVDRPFLCKEFS